MTLPSMYAPIARPPIAGGNSSATYASVTAKTAGMNSPCTNRHDEQRVERRRAPPRRTSPAASTKIAVTITRLRPSASASGPTNGDASAQAKVSTEIVAPTAASPVWNSSAQLRQQRLRRVHVEERGSAAGGDGQVARFEAHPPMIP